MLAAAPASLWAASAQAALPRFPQPYGDRIVFVADGNVWSVPKTGGAAERLTSAPGQDMFPRVSPDGRWIAYTEASRAGTDIWVIPAAGGAARRLTYRPTTEAGTGGRHGPDNMVVTWTPELEVRGLPDQAGPVERLDPEHVQGPGRRRHADADADRQRRGSGHLRPGRPHHRLQPDIPELPHLEALQWRSGPAGLHLRLRHQGAQPDHPLVRHQYVADVVRSQDLLSLRPGRAPAGQHLGLRPGHQADPQVTHFTDYDIDFPALGGDAIAFQEGGKLYRLDLPSEELHEVPVSVPDDNPRTRPHVQQVADEIRDSDPAGQVDYALAPNGERTLFSARGDIFSVPTENGPTRDLTGTQGADEDHPAWSPDGRTVAYTTDGTGGQQIAIRPAEGGPETVLTSFAEGYFYGPIFSPDGKTLAFSDSAHRLWIVRTDGGAPKQAAQDKSSEIHDQSFSPDGRWLAFSMTAYDRRRDLYLYEIASGKTTRLGDGSGIDANPVWSPDGKYLYFTSNRHENTVPSDQEFDFAILKSMGVYAIPLARDTASPMAPRSDEAERRSAEGQGRQGGRGVRRRGPDRADPHRPRQHDGACGRPADRSGEHRPDGRPRDQRIYYLTQPIGLIDGTLKGEKSALQFYDFKTRKNAVVAEDVDSYSLSLDGKRVLIKHDQDYTVLDTKPDAAKDADSKKRLDLDHMRLLVDPAQEWAEMYENAWRLERDLFFSPAMNGQDWKAVHDNYAKLLPLLGSREDLNYLIGQILGEISNSHTYVGGGDDGDTTPKTHAALLGVDWALDSASGRYRFAVIYPGDNTRDEYRSPLAQPGLAVKAGDYLLAVNGVELRAPTNPDSLLQLADADTTVDLTVADTPAGPRRHVVVKPVASELSLREAAWIAHNRAVVDKLSGGKVGYVYMSDMEQLGLQQFVRQFYGQLDKQALIVDDRWNGGGFIAPYALERLRRALVVLGTNRESAIETEPAQVLNGPKVALLNHWSSSDGDIFPYLFRLYGIGKLVGTRSWGGVRGIRGYWRMMDGGYITIPESALYTTDRQWSVENHGVDPDIEIEDMPADLLAGHDAQLETAVDLMLKAIAGRPAGLPAPPSLLPPYPPSGMVQPQPQP